MTRLQLFKSTPARWHSVQLDGFGDWNIGRMRRSKISCEDGRGAAEHERRTCHEADGEEKGGTTIHEPGLQNV